MILLDRRGTLALAAVLDVALHARPEPVAAKALSLRLNLPPRHLEPLLQSLVRGGILRGVRGPRGGYELARERRRISVTQVLAAVQNSGFEREDDWMPAIVEQVILPLGREISDKVLAEYEEVTINDLCLRAQSTAIAPPTTDPNDFTI